MGIAKYHTFYVIIAFMVKYGPMSRCTRSRW